MKSKVPSALTDKGPTNHGTQVEDVNMFQESGQ